MTTKAAAERKALRQAFKAAKIYLATNSEEIDGAKPRREEFICCSVDQAHFNGHISQESAHRAEALIMNRIYPSVTACQWLAAELGVDMMHLEEDDVQQWRHRWLDSLIQEFSK